MPESSMLDGNWISGFVDGEGCFYLAYRDTKKGNHPACEASFHLSLRDDDSDILHRINSYFLCGTVRPHVRRERAGNGKPCIGYAVHTIRDLANTIVPHFEKFPLQSKKQRDFAIWKRAVNLSWHVSNGLRFNDKPIYRSRGRRSRGKIGNHAVRTSDQLNEFEKLVIELRLVREYVSPNIAAR
jgi:hypothetical protein